MKAVLHARIAEPVKQPLNSYGLLTLGLPLAVAQARLAIGKAAFDGLKIS